MTKTIFRSATCFLLIFVMMFTALAPTAHAAYNDWNSLSVPLDMRLDHELIKYRAKGPCKYLEGDVVILSIFLEDGQSDWTDAEQQKVWNSQAQEIRNIENQAAQYGVTLDIRNMYVNVTVSNPSTFPQDSDFTPTKWVNEILAAAKLPTREKIIPWLKETYDCDEAAVMFYTDTIGVACAYMSEKYTSTMEEFTIMFKESNAYQHELFHLFGAKDLYYPNKVVEYALKYLGSSVMNDSSIPTTDVLTAYSLGWITGVNQETLNFLNATFKIPQSEYKDAKDARPDTGYGTETYINGTYVGDFFSGIRHGYGTYTWTSGAVYTGAWDNGERTGYGIETYTNGNRYEGNFFKGEYSGFGTFYWADGTVYEGNWKDSSTKSGYGTMTWTNGEKYVGNFENDLRNGYGTYTWKNGGKYEGNWKDGKQHGYGVFTRKGYKTQKGNWVNGKFKGK